MEELVTGAYITPIKNGARITGYTSGTSVVLTYNTIFPSVSSGYGYVSVPAASSTIKLSVTGKVNPGSIRIASFTKTLAPDQLYTFMITDSLNLNRDSSQIFVQDTCQPPTQGFFKPGTITNFTQYPSNALYSDTLYVRRTDTGQSLDTLKYSKFQQSTQLYPVL